jgi:hypothetical protein
VSTLLNPAELSEIAFFHPVFGSLLRTLENMDPDAEIQDLAFPHSYRGYHEDLALELIPDERMLAKNLHVVMKNFYAELTDGDVLFSEVEIS